jgi:flavin reductase (DIM6/NTAB) family NADH-FMN oxidoreductase RutF
MAGPLTRPGATPGPGPDPGAGSPAPAASAPDQGRGPDPGPGPGQAAWAGPPGQATEAALAEALSLFATGVTLVMVADGRDDIGTTVSAFCPVSLSPPLVLVSLIAASYPAEVLGRVEGFAITVLSEGQRALAGRFAVAGRPGARLLLAEVPHHRGAASGALIPSGGLAALECQVSQRIPAGDHLIVIGRVLAVPYVAEDGRPLIRFASRYPALR